MSNGIKVKVLDVNGNFVSLRYRTTNRVSRMRKSDFITNFGKGDFDVLNMSQLEPSFLDQLNEND